MLAAASGGAQARPAPDSFSQVVQKLSPAVVNIATIIAAPAGTGVLLNAQDVPQAAPGSPLSQYLDKNRAPTPEAGKTQAVGSGFIIDPAGYIVTNHHVVRGAESITVTLVNGVRLPAQLKGVDPKTDLALIKVEPKTPLPALAWGDSDRAAVGDWVVAIGNPYGLGGSVTAGIISARNRELNLGSYDDFIQTDAAINTGNSGGPLFNLEGEVIGINSALLSPSGGSVGIGFAIASNVARSVILQLKQFGETRRGWIGVRVQSVSPEIAESLGLALPKGALIAAITPNGPAARAGLEPGDLVTRFDGRDVPDMRMLPQTIADTDIGKTVTVEIWRKARAQSFSVKVERLAENGQTRVASAPASPVMPAALTRSIGLGLTLAPLDPAARAKYGVPATVEGALVVSVEPASAAAGNEVQVGDVIVQVAQAPVKSAEAATAMVEEAKRTKKRVVLFGINRRGELNFKALRF